MLTFEGHTQLETQILVALKNRFYFVQKIADTLNQLAGTSPEDNNYRTATSVQQKLSELGLTFDQRRSDFESVYLPDYGYVKSSGRLVTEIAIKFLFDHDERSDDWLAKKLEINVERLKEFYRVHFLYREGQATRTPFRINQSARRPETLRLLKIMRNNARRESHLPRLAPLSFLVKRVYRSLLNLLS